MREVVKFPARKVGAFFENGLVEVVLRDVQRQRGSLPLLQHALKELWQARRGPWLTLDAYEKSGGVAGALRRRAQYTYEKKLQDDQQRGIARGIFLRLTTLGEGVSDSRRRAPRAELFPSGIDRRVVDDVLAVLSHKDARLVVVNADDTIEVTHETLIQTWNTLRGWIDANRQQLRRHRRLTESANEWKENEEDASILYRGGQLEDVKDLQTSHGIALNKSELAFLETSVAEQKREEEEKQRQLRQRQRLLAGVAVLFAVLFIAASGAAIFGFWQKIEAEKQKQVAVVANVNLEAKNRELSYMLEEAARSDRLVAEAELQGGKDADALAYLARASRYVPKSSLPAEAAIPVALLPSIAHSQVAFRGHRGRITSAAFSPDGRRVLTASQDNTARLWEAESGKLLITFQGHTRWVNSAVFSPDGRRVLTASDDATARLWEADSGKLLVTFQGHTGGVTRAVFSPDGRRVLTASASFSSEDNTARLWETDSAKPLAAFLGHFGPVSSAVFSSDGRRVLTASEDGTARLLEADSGKLLVTFQGHTNWVTSAVFSPDGRRVLTASDDATARLWETDSGKLLATFQGHTGSVRSAVFSPDGRRVLTASEDNTARLWEADSGKLLATFQGHTDKVTSAVMSAAFGQDGRRVLTASWDDIAWLWEADSGDLLASFQGHTGPVSSAVFSPDGRRVLTASYDKTARLWEADSGKLLASFQAHTGPVTSAVFSPDGRRVLTASEDATARLWETDSGKLLATFRGHTGSVSSAVFSQDGRRVLTASYDATARLWPVLPAGVPPPDWYRDFLVWLGGKQIALDGQIETLSGDELGKLEDRLRPHLTEDSDYARLLRWRLLPPLERPVDPYARSHKSRRLI